MHKKFVLFLEETYAAFFGNLYSLTLLIIQTKLVISLMRYLLIIRMQEFVLFLLRSVNFFVTYFLLDKYNIIY